jgi:hypothetical protein
VAGRDSELVGVSGPAIDFARSARLSAVPDVCEFHQASDDAIVHRQSCGDGFGGEPNARHDYEFYL